MSGDLTRHTPAGNPRFPGKCWCGEYHYAPGEAPPKRILICGSRDWADGALVGRRMSELPAGTVIIEGGARGADTYARLCAEALGFEWVPFEADWRRYGLAAGPRRNAQMLAEGKPDLVWAFHDAWEQSRGTKDMIEKARKAGVPVRTTSHYKTEEALAPLCSGDHDKPCAVHPLTSGR